MKLGLQLYTVRDCCTDRASVFKTLEEIKKMGYEGVQLAGYYGIPAPEMREKLEELGLLYISGHDNSARLAENMEEILEYNRLMGSSHIVCSHAPAATLEDLENLRILMEKLVPRAKALGMHVSYHNHRQEFAPIGGLRPIDEIRKYCLLEPDTYWSFAAGADTRAFMLENRDRISLVHLKDGDRNANPCAVGEGVADIQTVIDTSKLIDAQWLIVENDRPHPNGLEDARRSIEHLKNMYTL
jgi:sugar phosphate isomerase/epimerase